MRQKGILTYIMKGILFSLASGSISHGILKSLYFPVPFAITMTFTALGYILLSIYLWNKWSLCILMTLSIVSFGIYYYFMTPDWIEYIHLTTTWLYNYSLGLSSLNEMLIPTATGFIVFGVSTIFYCLLIKFKLTLIPFLLGSSILITLWFLGHIHIISEAWIFALAILLQIGAKSHKKLSSYMTLPEYGIWQLAILPIATFIIITAMVITPNDTRNLKWSYLEDTYTAIQNDISDIFRFSSPRQPFRLSQTGFTSSSGELGGPVSLNNDLALTVSSPQPLYLRGSILNEYTGSGWIDSIDDMRYKYSDPLFTNTKNQAFDFDESIWKTLDEDTLDVFFPDVAFNITHIGIDTSVLFNTQMTKEIKAEKSGAFTAYYNSKGESFTSRLLGETDTYVVHSRIPDMNNELFLGYISINSELPSSILYESTTGADDKLYDIYDKYTYLPSTVPQRVNLLALDIIAESSNSLEMILSIQNYLKNNYSYTLDPPHTPLDVDFVDYFLFELERGYCTYFATAMAVLGRSVGIPTRYIEGFSMPNESNDDNIFEITNAYAHAWVEVYFPGVGWLPFDPTPSGPGNESGGATGAFSDNSYPHMDQYINQYEQYLSNNYNHDVNVPIFDGADSSNSSGNLYVFFLYVFVIVVFILICLSLILCWYKGRCKKRKKLSLNEQLHAYYNDILWILEEYGCPVEKGETPYNYAQRIDKWLINSQCSMGDICNILVENEFGNRSLTINDATLIMNFYIELEKSIKGQIGLIRYLYKLILRGTKSHTN